MHTKGKRPNPFVEWLGLERWAAGNENWAVRTTIEITDRAGFTQRVSLFGRTSAPGGVYVVAKLPRGDLVALNRAYAPIGFLVGDEKALWQELLDHPAKFQYE